MKAKEEKLMVLKRADEEVKTVYEIPETVEAPVKEGQQVGCVRYFLGEKQIAEFPICAARSVKKQSDAWYKNYLMKLFFMEKNFYFEENEPSS